MLSILSKARKKRLDGEQGFTLIELLVVVVILGILIAIAIPVYLNYKKSANDKAAQSDLRNAISALEVCGTENGYPATVSGAGVISGAVACSQTINTSDNTLLRYVPSPASGTATSYTMYSNNSSGSGKIYCYNSASGGSVKPSGSTGSTAAALAAATCP